MDDLELIPMVIEESVAAGELAGAAVSVWRDGHIAYAGGTGWRNIDAKLPVERDTLFRIASMSKAITHTAALMCYETGQFQLDEPISKWASEFETMKVLQSPQASLDNVVAADRPLTFRDLLTHRAGLTYGSFHAGTALGRAYAQSLGGEIDSPVDPDEWIASIAALPLLCQPGSEFHYGHATDLLGLLLERMNKAPLESVLRSLVFDPMGMKDTTFVVPAEKQHRCAELYGFDAAGGLKQRDVAAGGATVKQRPPTMKFTSGGQGLWSTVDDFTTFARLFLNDGEIDGKRWLQPETLRLLTTNQMTPEQRRDARLMGRAAFAAGHGYSMGLAVVVDEAAADPMVCGGSVGSVGWPGAFGGWWQADPMKKSVAVFLTHNIVELHQLAQGVGLGVYGAIEQIQSLVDA